MENHAVDIPWWGDLVNGVPKPIIQNGYIQVPDTPGIGVELNEESVPGAPARAGVLRAHPAIRQVHSRRNYRTAVRIRTWTRTASFVNTR